MGLFIEEFAKNISGTFVVSIYFPLTVPVLFFQSALTLVPVYLCMCLLPQTHLIPGKKRNYPYSPTMYLNFITLSFEIVYLEQHCATDNINISRE